MLEVAQSEIIGYVKNKIHGKVGFFPILQQILLFNGVTMADDPTLISYSIQSEASLFLEINEPRTEIFVLDLRKKLLKCKFVPSRSIALNLQSVTVHPEHVNVWHGPIKLNKEKNIEHP